MSLMIDFGRWQQRIDSEERVADWRELWWYVHTARVQADMAQRVGDERNQRTWEALQGYAESALQRVRHPVEA